MFTCLIVDDSLRFLAAARGLLEREGVAIVGVASTGAQAAELVDRLRPDVVLLDLDLGGESGFEVARQLARALPALRIILISTHTEQDYADLIEASPAVGFLPKAGLSAGAIRTLLNGAGDGGGDGGGGGAEPVSGPPGR